MSEPQIGDDRTVEDRPLPAPVGENLQALFGTDARPGTFGEWIDAIAAAVDDWPPDVADLCHDAEGRHRAETSAQSFRFTCVVDAILLPFLVDEPVEIESVDPVDETTVSAAVTTEGIETTPDEAVMSFGVFANYPETSDEAGPTPVEIYRSLCPYVHAFPDRETYERWAEEADAPTTAVLLADGFDVARAMVRA